MQRIGIIGVGRFGWALATELAEKGVEVIVLDSDREKVKRMSSIVARAVQGDATNIDALSESGIADCDAVVVAIGTSVEASVLATIMLKEMKVRYIVAEAASDTHGKALGRIGADKVVYPHRDVAARLARALWAPAVLDYFEISEGVSIMEVKCPSWLVGKTLGEARIRNVLKVTILSIVRQSLVSGQREKIVAPTGESMICEGDTLIVFGTDKDLEKLRE
jgi:trk system potassium uptake protein TrkA